MNTASTPSSRNGDGYSEVLLTVANQLNWVVDLSNLNGLPKNLLDTLMALDRNLRSEGHQLEATGVHISHVGGNDFPKLVKLYGAQSTLQNTGVSHPSRFNS